MKLLIDGTETGNIDLKNETKQSIAAAVEDFYKVNDRIIVFVKDEKGDRFDFYNDDVITRLGNSSGFVDVITATAKELALANIYDSAVLLEKVKKDLKESSEYLITGDLEKGMVKFSRLVNDIGAVMKAMESLESAGFMRGTDGKGSAAGFFGDTDGLNSLLVKIGEAIKIEDQVGVSDLLEYELLPVVEKWQDDMPALFKGIMEGTQLN